jgi:hypothetical protein
MKMSVAGTQNAIGVMKITNTIVTDNRESMRD